MAWPRSNKLRQALSVALLATIGTVSIGPSTHAAIIGKTQVQSAQNEPLRASIAVTGIDISDFSASLVGQDIYRQMGLQPDDSMSVSFEPTSQTSGRILITTSKPVSAPFADVVLAIRDQGRQQVIPKTLLMPLEDSAARVATNRQLVNTFKPNLPVVAQSAASQAQTVGTPLQIKRGAPPPLLSSASQEALAAVNLPGSTNASSDTQAHSRASGALMMASPDSSSAMSAYGQNNLQLDILKVQITRKIIASAPAPLAATAATPSNRPEQVASTLAAASPSDSAAEKRLATAANAANASTIAVKPSNISYTVQRHDSLWMIADEIARQNKVSVKTVMEQIKALNPNAFINNDINQLRANARLNLPNYNVVPSEQSLKAALEARRSQQLSARQKNKTNINASANPTSVKASTAKSTAASGTNVVQKLPQARMTVLAPGKDGKADGTQTKSTASTGTGISTETMATLQSTRQRTAQQAQRVREVNQQLASYTKKLQLQNQKLAELEAHLQELRNR